MGSSKRERLLITVLTYPHPSTKYQETVCTAAITDDGRWVRLYPIPLRSLPPEQRLRKWHWIEISTKPRSQDQRPESRVPDLESIRILEKLDPRRDREERRRLVDQLPVKTLKDWIAGYEADKSSLGVLAPRRVMDLEVEPDRSEWTEKEKSALSQLDLFADRPMRLERIPYRFRYLFEDQDGVEHRLTIRDWELGVLFLKMRDHHGEAIAIEKVRQKFLRQVCAPDKDTRFFIGTINPYNQWIIVGVFWPPKPKPRISEQPGLFEEDFESRDG